MKLSQIILSMIEVLVNSPRGFEIPGCCPAWASLSHGWEASSELIVNSPIDGFIIKVIVRAPPYYYNPHYRYECNVCN